jgi:hypothetical protein
MHRFGLRDDQWNRIKDLLPGRPGTVGVTAEDNRIFVDDAVVPCQECCGHAIFHRENRGRTS